MSICWGCVVTASSFVSVYGLGHVTALVRSVGRARAMRAVEEETSTAPQRIEDPSASCVSNHSSVAIESAWHHEALPEGAGQNSRR